LELRVGWKTGGQARQKSAQIWALESSLKTINIQIPVCQHLTQFGQQKEI